MEFALCPGRGLKSHQNLLFPLDLRGNSCGHGRCKDCIYSDFEKGVREGQVAKCFLCHYPGCGGKLSFAQVEMSLNGRENGRDVLGKVEDGISRYAFVESKEGNQSIL